MSAKLGRFALAREAAARSTSLENAPIQPIFDIELSENRTTERNRDDNYFGPDLSCTRKAITFV
jgi:hypothetical protein